MSSDSDEDELLQMALKEQAQRDLTYQKPPSSSSSRPVANLVQQPRQHKPSPARKPSMDEPEVELLSISSEDDDVERESDVRERGRAKKEDDGGGALDGEEPDCWKRVNEAELARRVRDMRESRTAPVVQKLEDKVSEPGKKVVLTSLQSLPRVMECIDPLKLGIIDNKTLRLISESFGSPSKAEKVDNTLREKLIYFSDHLKLFLSRIHQDTSAADLEAGALGLKSDLKGRNLQRKQLVKDNFDCFISCKTTIDDIESKLKRIEEDPEGSGTTHVFNCMKSVTSRANLAFEPLFERQAQAEKIRSVQGMLQRLAFLNCFLDFAEKVLEHYTFSKANLIRTAATSYLLDSGIQWGSAPQVIETVLEIALESVSESVETTPGHNRRPTRGSEDTASDDRQGSSVSADELLVLTKQYSSELLQTEMERTSRNYRGSQSSGSPIHARPRQR
ncbi:hypothetical protein BRARA_B02182 [Brassica rapa]|uniref:Exocyst complex component SEC5 n=1 Tax=Brassica campestris TaxID=3711 RepID=A0A398AEK8_BRACM|nr:hypothetical protein BRARA_B02182 [Brassica rapa]